MNKNLQVGDYFAFRIRGSGNGYINGRLIFDATLKKVRELDKDFNFNFVQDCYLIRIYEGIFDDADIKNIDETKVLIPSLYIFKSSFYKKLYNPSWEYLGFKEMNPKDVDFPEVHKNHNKLYFNTGEINIPHQSDSNIRLNIHTSQGQVLMYALHYLKRDDIVEKEYVVPYAYLEKEDLRFAPEKRLEVYKAIGEDPGQTYYEMALKHGFDLARFYN